MSPTRSALLRGVARVLDLRPGEGRVAGGAFATLLLLVTGHTLLETARDALLLAKLPPRALGVVYLAVAALTLPVSALTARLSTRIGPGRALAVTLVLAGAATVSLHEVPTSRASVIALYVLSGLIGAVLIPQFWILLATQLTVAQGRRLIGTIAAAGVIGGVTGSGLSAAMLLLLPVHSLLLVAGAAFILVSILVIVGPTDTRLPPPPERRATQPTPLASVRKEPFLIRIALLVTLSTATVLTVDYLFKWTVARTIPAPELGHFFARYYAALNGASLVVQLLVGGALVRRLGVVATVSITPALLALGGIGTLLSGGALPTVLGVKAVDGSLRHSLHRVTTELVYLPVAPKIRDRAKPLIDGPLARVVQAVTAASLLALGETHVLSRHALEFTLLVLAVAWLATAATLRRPYLSLLRRALSASPLDSRPGPEPIDVANAELLVERLASRDPSEVVAAMKVLTRRGRGRLVPALVLYHHDERVLLYALEAFGASTRTDWIPLAERLVGDPREAIRSAATRALAQRGKLEELERLANDGSPRVQGYVAVHLALREAGALASHPKITPLLEADADDGRTGRLGMLAALADAPPSARASALLIELARRDAEDRSPEWVTALARAVARQRELRLLPLLLEQLTMSEGREAVRAALVDLGEPALDASWATLQDRARDRHLRVHLPRTLARFGTRRAAEYLLENLESESDGLVRYKSLRGLGRLVADFNVRVDRGRVERLACRNLTEHLRLLGLRTALGTAHTYDRASDPRRARATGELLVGLLEDKLNQSLERAFRLLKIAHPREDIHRVNVAALSNDKRARANAAEFLDTLLTRRDQEPLRSLLRLVIDDLEPADRIARAAPYLERPAPRTRDEALLALVEDPDVTMASIASVHALALGDAPLRAAAARAAKERAEVDRGAARLLDAPIPLREPAHA